ncbi:RHS repeat domain-containing protein, partial [Neotamlana laminarinivorans]
LCTIMKNILLIIIISVYTSSFSQVKIDTSEIKSVRYEWKIDTKRKDTTLNQILTEYKSGIYKEVFPNFKREHHRYPFINIFESKTEYLNKKIKPNLKVHYWSVSRGLQKNFYDEFGNLDSIYSNYYKDSLIEKKYKINKVYKRKGKLKYLINKFGEKEEHFYSLLGKLKRIEKSNDSVTFLTEYFKNGRIVKVDYRNGIKFNYEYDKKGRLTKLNDRTGTYYYRYNDSKLDSIDKFLSKSNKLYERILFGYNENGILIEKKEYKKIGDKERLINEYKYIYK